MKRWLLLLFLIFLIPTPASAQFGGCLPALCGKAVAPPPSCIEAVTFLTRTSGLDTPHRNNYINLICGLVTDGVWPKLDYIYTFATQDQTTANLNLVSSDFTVIPQASPAWAVDRGYTGIANSSTVYLFTNFAPPGCIIHSPLCLAWTTNNAHFSVWSNTAGQTNGWATGISGGPGNGSTFILTRDLADKAQFNINSVPGIIVSNTDGHGLFEVNMSGGNTIDVYINGSSVGTLGTTALDPWGGPIPLLAAGIYAGTIQHGWDGQMSAATAGGSLTSTDHANLYARLRTYMTAVGVP
jgi:hypothetical protein